MKVSKWQAETANKKKKGNEGCTHLHTHRHTLESKRSGQDVRWMDVRLSRRPLLEPPLPPVSPANCVNGKATAAFANFAAAATKAKAQPQQKLHKCIYIYIYLSDGRALYCSYVLDGPAKWRGEKNLWNKINKEAPRTAGVFSFEKSWIHFSYKHLRNTSPYNQNICKNLHLYSWYCWKQSEYLLE